MDNLIRKLYNALMGTDGDEGPVLNRIVVALIFTSFVIAFVIISAVFLYSNVRL